MKEAERVWREPRGAVTAGHAPDGPAHVAHDARRQVPLPPATRPPGHVTAGHVRSRPARQVTSPDPIASHVRSRVARQVTSPDPIANHIRLCPDRSRPPYPIACHVRSRPARQAGHVTHCVCVFARLAVAYGGVGAVAQLHLVVGVHL